jgi:hypothetical protein
LPASQPIFVRVNNLSGRRALVEPNCRGPDDSLDELGSFHLAVSRFCRNEVVRFNATQSWVLTQPARSSHARHFVRDAFQTKGNQWELIFSLRRPVCSDIRPISSASCYGIFDVA